MVPYSRKNGRGRGEIPSGLSLSLLSLFLVTQMGTSIAFLRKEGRKPFFFLPPLSTEQMKSDCWRRKGNGGGTTTTMRRIRRGGTILLLLLLLLLLPRIHNRRTSIIRQRQKPNSHLSLSPEQCPKATNLFLLISSPLCPPGKQTRAERRKEEEGGDTFVDMHAWRRKVEIFLSLSSRASEP